MVDPKQTGMMVLYDDENIKKRKLKEGMTVQVSMENKGSLSATLQSIQRDPKTGKKSYKVHIGAINSVRFVRKSDIELGDHIPLILNRSLVHVKHDDAGRPLHLLNDFDKLLKDKYCSKSGTDGGKTKHARKFVAGMPSYNSALNAWHKSGIDHFVRHQTKVPHDFYRKTSSNPNRGY